MTTRKSKLQSEIAQKRPFQSLGHEAVLSVMRTSDELKHRYVDVVAAEGLTHQQYNVLRILRGAEPDGLPTLVIAERMIERTPGITGLIDRLADKGLVMRTPCHEDRRRVICRITSSGLEMLARLDEPMAARDDELLQVLAESEIETLIGLLDRVRAG